MRDIILVFSLLFVHFCGNNMGGIKNSSTQQLGNNEFNKFIENFIPKQLPLSVIPKIDKEFNFDRGISIGDAKKFLCTNSASNCVEQPGGGYYNFYYSDIVKVNNGNLLFLSFYRVSESGTDYILNVYDAVGKFISSLIIGGQVDEVSQTESTISNECEIKVTNWLIVNKESDNVFLTEKETKLYSIDKQGNINLINSIKQGQIKCKIEREQNFRLIEIAK
jgi:hypothetical protein